MLARSGERLSFYQLFTEKSLKVEIPIIQRDYAQGRDNESAVREAFLSALYDYLQRGEPFRDLDFVYGSIVEAEITKVQGGEDEPSFKFIPLDGQQRLTTLFLLHWYLAQISDNSESLRRVFSVNERSLFSYETRNSSREFCDALIQNNLQINNLLKDENGNDSIAVTIQDMGWFYRSWMKDPTIRSMLTMLDAIHIKFDSCGDFFARLVDSTEPVITFLFLNLQEFKLTDDLYIKMNARGKPLTDFENFKARLEKLIKSFQGEWPEYALSFKSEPVSGYDYFIHNIDNDWADLFWAYRNEASADNTFDDELMNFIAHVIANHQILRKDIEFVELTKSRNKLFGTGGSLRRLSYIEYENLGCLTQSLIVELIKIFELLHNDGLSNGQLATHLSENNHYSEEAIFKKVITNKTSYTENLRFYAFYAALSKVGKGELPQWMRVIYNLSENTIINTADEYHRALRSIRDLLKGDGTVLEKLRKDISVQGFTEAQVLEEKVKAHLFEKSTDWVNEIEELEAHSFFRGQVGFALKFSGIVDYYLENGNTDCVDEDDGFLKKFRKYASSASAIFDCIEHSSGKIDYLWERTVLTKGVYLTSASAHRYNLLSTRLTKNNIERDHSWRRLLRLPLKKGDAWDERQGYVKAVFDDPVFDVDNLQESLQSICDTFIQRQGDEIKDWRILLVKTPDLFKLCHQGFIVKNSEEFILLHESQRNHYHSEAYSKYLELEIKANFLDIKPFKSLSYEKAKSGSDYTYIELSGFKNEQRHYVMNVLYEEGKYSFMFYDKNDKSCSKDLINLLTEIGFSLNDDKGWKEYKKGYIFKCDTPQDALLTLNSICEKLRNLIDE